MRRWNEGVAAARVQGVHLQPSILSSGCIASVLMKNCHESGPWRVKKGAVLCKNVVHFSIFGIRGCLHCLLIISAPVHQSLWRRPCANLTPVKDVEFLTDRIKTFQTRLNFHVTFLFKYGDAI